MTSVLLALLVLAESGAGGARRPPARAAFTPAPPLIDGRIDEAAWHNAELLTDFVQVTPSEGSRATEQTEVRVLYDRKAVYFAFRCHDSQARQLRPRLARRDGLSMTDWVGVALDTAHDRRNAFVFVLTSAGTLVDGTMSEGGGDTRLEWDGLWEGRTSVDADGWSAEMAIPYSTLRFPRAPTQRWGMFVRRMLARNSELSDWSLVRNTDTSVVGRFPDLIGIDGVEPGLSLQVVPSLTGRTRLSFAEDGLAPRDRFGIDAGVDAKYGLTGTLTLDATFNPDFGQVEVDPAVLNLTAYETFFPEKRHFFLEGADLFEVAHAPWREGMAFVYTRRIGAPPRPPDPSHGGSVVTLDPTTRILGAAKLTGNLRPGTAVSLLAAQVAGSTALERVDTPGGPATFRLRASPPTTYSAARVRQRLGTHTTVGGTATSVIRHGADPEAHVLTADFDVRGEGPYTATGFASVSATAACDPARSSSFRAGDRCDRLGGWLMAGKTGGTLQLFGSFEYTGAQFDINDLGFMSHLLGNQELSPAVQASWRQTQPLGPLAELGLNLVWAAAWDPAAAAPGVATPLTTNFAIFNGWTRFSRGNWRLNGELTHQLSSTFDDAETRGNRNVRVLWRPALDTGSLRIGSDPSRAVSFAARGWLNTDGFDRTRGLALDSNLELQRLQLGAGGSLLRTRNHLRRIGETEDQFPLLARLDLDQMDAYLRASGTITRDFTLQLYTQLLRAAERYAGPGALREPRALLACESDGRCGPDGAPGKSDSTFTALLFNAVLRWEYRPGSTLFLVYTHDHHLSAPGGRFALGSAPQALASTGADNALVLKLTYLWAI